jgi:mercuric ion transport protein
MTVRTKNIVPSLLTLGGLGAAFGLAACCALPLMLLSLGFGTAWLVGIGFYAGMHRPAFLAVAIAGLIGGAVTLVVYRKRIGAAARAVMSIALLLGVVLLYYGYIYA